MLSRICYSLSAAWRYRSQLKSYYLNPQLQLSVVMDLDLNTLQKRKILALVLDFDGVLAAHAELVLRPEVVVWLRALQKKFAPHKIYILSNKPTPERQKYFSHNFPELGFIIAKRKKPYPDGLQQIMQESGLAASRLLLIDDRLTTGILAAVSCGVQAYWLNKPYINLRFRPCAEIWFMLLRYLERVGCKII